MMFSKRHYVFLANFYGLECRNLGVDTNAVECMAARLARWLREDNSRFDETRFLAHVHAVASGAKVVTQ